ncbi:MAG: phosphopentomutase [Gemmatimonadota bacterium]|nr:phosphopentomutase [Gemmatimonadota bacterium]
MSARAAIIVLDGVGVGAAPDAAAYGDEGSDTLGHVALAVGGARLPTLERAGLGRIARIAGVAAVAAPVAAWGRMRPASAGKDSISGHWEIAGVHLDRPFPTYPCGFPPELVAELESLTGRRVIGNVVGGGTDVIARFGPQHEITGAWILYTSADSVFQLAAHERVVPLDDLYEACRLARSLLTPPHEVSRVIARPFIGHGGAYARTANRRDFSVAPPQETLLDALEGAGIPRRGVGKVDDLFAHRGIASTHTADNAEGLVAIHRALREMESGLLFANLVDFDQLWGHRNDVAGFYEGLRDFDRSLPALLDALTEDDVLFLTADHGNDPTTAGSDHAREGVPLLAFGARVRPVSLGERPTFSDLGATVAEWLGVNFRGRGASFLAEMLVP